MQRKSDAPPFRLQWDEVSPTQWQAGGIGRVFTIIEEERRFTLELQVGDEMPEHIGEFATLGGAQMRAHHIFTSSTGRVSHADDPLGAALAKHHPDRKVA